MINRLYYYKGHRRKSQLKQRYNIEDKAGQFVQTVALDQTLKKILVIVCVTLSF